MSHRRDNNSLPSLPYHECDDMNFDQYFDFSSLETHHEASQPELIPARCILHGPDCDGFGDEHQRREIEDVEGFIHECETEAGGSKGGAVPAPAEASQFTVPAIIRSQRASQSQPVHAYGNVALAGNPPGSTLSASPLGRDVTILQGAFRTCQQTMAAHDNLVGDEMARWYSRVATYAALFERKRNIPDQHTRRMLEDQALKRVYHLQTTLIEPRVGAFSKYQKAQVEKLNRFEHRLFETLYIGLLMQELSHSKEHEDADPKRKLDVNGSCFLEARVWQLEMLKEWTVWLEKAIHGAGGHVPILDEG